MQAGSGAALLSARAMFSMLSGRAAKVLDASGRGILADASVWTKHVNVSLLRLMDLARLSAYWQRACGPPPTYRAHTQLCGCCGRVCGSWDTRICSRRLLVPCSAAGCVGGKRHADAARLSCWTACCCAGLEAWLRAQHN